MTRQSIAKKLSLVAKEKGITPNKIKTATNYKISYDQAKSVFNGDKNFTIDTLLIVCEVLGVNVVLDDAGKKLEDSTRQKPTPAVAVVKEEEITPKTLSDLKAICPHKSGLERSAWIAENRKKYNL